LAENEYPYQANEKRGSSKAGLRIRITIKRKWINLFTFRGSESDFSLSADPYPNFHFKADPAPAPHQSCESTITGLWTLQGSILSLHASIVSVNGPPYLHFEPLKLLNFDFNADLDPHQLFPLMWIRIQLVSLMHIRIQLPKIRRIHAEQNQRRRGKEDYRRKHHILILIAWFWMKIRKQNWATQKQNFELSVPFLDRRLGH
jgi:hypothetical protein